MKKVLIIFCALFLFACSSNDQKPSSVKELEIGTGDGDISLREKNSIAKKGEVDVYHVNVVEANRVVQFRCTGPEKAKVDLLVHVFELGGDGKLHMIAGNQAKVDAQEDADVRVNVFVDSPKELFVHVRDFLDDEASEDEIYYLSADYGSVSDDNNTFATAEVLTLNEEGVSNELRDTIGSLGDEDFFSFSITTPGVYDFHIDYDAHTDTTVTLSVELFDSEGTSLENGPRNMGYSREGHLLHALEAGTYTVVVKDQGENDYDLSSYYTVDVSLLDEGEFNENDTIPEASDAIPEDAAIGYFSDKDWYAVNYVNAGNLNILDFTFSSESQLRYQINMYQATSTDEEPAIENALFTRYFDGGQGDSLNAILKLEPPVEGQDYYIVVKPQYGSQVSQVCPYTATMTVRAVDDADEEDFGDNWDGNPMNISDVGADPYPHPHTGMVSYQSDVDWYAINLTPENIDRVLAVTVDIPDNPLVEYAMLVKRKGSENEPTVIFYGTRDQRETDLKTSFIVPAQSSGEVTYLVKVYDLQGDDGENRDEQGQNKTYSIDWSIADIPTTVAPAAIPAGSGITTFTYNDEKNEQDETADYGQAIEIDYTTGEDNKGHFKSNTALMDFSNATVSGDGTTLTFPWICGYIDYQHDEDWYTIDLGMPLDAGDTAWYYDIKFELLADGSDVEYAWNYYPDSDNNGNVHVRRCNSSTYYCEGCQAFGADETLTADAVDLNSLYDSGNFLWYGSGDGLSWRTCVETNENDECTRYTGLVHFQITDFNYFFTSTNVINTQPDADWGYDAPYFFRVVLTYHGGTSHPANAALLQGL